MRAVSAAIIVALVAGVAACGDEDSPVSVGTEVGEVTVSLRDDQLCLDGESKGGFCGDRPTSAHPVAWGTSTSGGPGDRTYVWGVATPEVTAFDVVVTGEDPITPTLHEIDGGAFDGMSVWAIQLGRSGEPIAAGAPDITIKNIETT